ncbi:MAG: hypothetical protein ACRC68_02275 [Clostridium sp.]
MARGRKKLEIPDGYVKERFNLDLVVKKEMIEKINEIGRTKYLTSLIEKDSNSSLSDDTSLNLIVTDEIREKFNSDPRRAYLLGQLLTEFYCGGTIQTTSNIVVQSKVEKEITKTVELEDEKNFKNIEIAVELEETLVNDNKIIEKQVEIIEENNRETIENIDLEKGKELNIEEKNMIKPVEEVISNDNSEIIPIAQENINSRVANLANKPLMKKTIGGK